MFGLKISSLRDNGLMFKKLYNKTLALSSHKNAEYFLYSVSFIESSFFPIPPDAMLIPMAMAKPDKSWRYAFLTTIFSVLGGILGYLIGFLAFNFIFELIIQNFGYEQQYHILETWFDKWGILLVFIAGFTPVPYKLFTIASGSLNLNFPAFVVISCVSRGLRFFLVSGFIYYFGARLEKAIYKWLDIIGYGSIIIFVLAIFIYKLT